MTEQEALAIADETRTLVFANIAHKDALRVLAARVRELEEQTCDRCKHQRHDDDPEPHCALTEGDDDYFFCRVFGHTCGAWKERGGSDDAH